MTDETRLHGMMADPGPAPNHDANGWPADELPPTSVLLDSMKIAWQRDEDGNWHPSDDQRTGGVPFAELDRRHDGDLTLIYMPGAVDLPPDELLCTDSAGPASSSASTSGTGGLTELAELLHTASTAELVQAVFDRWEGVQRALWDLTVAATYQAQVDGWTVAGRASRAVTLRAAYSIVSGISEAAVDKLLAAELDARYGPDRVGGGPS